MRALTLWQPMAWAIVERHKPIENRPWRLPPKLLGKRFAVHAGKTYDDAWATMVRETFGLNVPTKDQITRGAIVGVATFAGCVNQVQLDALTDESMTKMDMGTTPLQSVRDWFWGPFGFLLRDRHALAQPIPCRGMQGLWTVRPDHLQQIEQQLGGIVAPSSPCEGGQLSLLEREESGG